MQDQHAPPAAHFTDADVAKATDLIMVEKNIAWALGDLVQSFAAPGIDGADEALAAFAEKIDYPVKRLTDYRDVAADWPPAARRADTSYTVHRDLTKYDVQDRHTLIHTRKWTATTLRQHLGQASANTRVSHKTLTSAEREQQSASLLTAMTDDERASLLMKNPGLAQALLAAASKASDVDDDTPITDPAKPQPPKARYGEDLVDYLHDVDLGIRRRLQVLVERGHDVPPGVRGGAQHQAAALALTLTWVQTWSGGADLTDQIDAFLSEITEEN